MLYSYVDYYFNVLSLSYIWYDTYLLDKSLYKKRVKYRCLLADGSFCALLTVCVGVRRNATKSPRSSPIVSTDSRDRWCIGGLSQPRRARQSGTRVRTGTSRPQRTLRADKSRRYGHRRTASNLSFLLQYVIWLCLPLRSVRSQSQLTDRMDERPPAFNKFATYFWREKSERVSLDRKKKRDLFLKCTKTLDPTCSRCVRRHRHDSCNW